MKKAFITVAVILLFVAIGITSNAIAGADGCPCEPETPSPTNGSNQISIYAYLNWSGCSNASYYNVNFSTSDPPTYHENTSNSSYQLPQLNYSTTYYWQIVAFNNSTCNTSGLVWSFTTADAPPPTPTPTPTPTPCVIPTKPQTPSPTNGFTNTSTIILLSWNASTNASYYDVYYGTSESPEYYRNTYSSSCQLPQLNISTKYYWQVVAKNACGFNSSDIWNFTTGCHFPTKPQIQSPMNGSDQISVYAYLSWNASINASLYDVYFGTSATPTYYGNTSNSSYQLPQLNHSTKYYWKVVARNDCDINSSDIWTFTTGCPVPTRPQTPTPMNGSDQTSIYAPISWNASANASYYEVYFGTSEPPAYYGSTNNSVYQLPQLNISTKYYWKIVARNDCDINSSDIWNFTTGCPIPTRPQTPTPMNVSDQISIYAYMSWNASTNASLYDVYFGTSEPLTYHGNTSNSNYQIPQLNISTKYYWKVVARNVCGNNSSDIWNFTTGNASAQALINIDGTIASLNINSSGALQHDVNVSSPDGGVNINISSETVMLDKDEQPLDNLSVTAVDPLPDPPEGGHVLAAFDFQPDGATFHPGIQITLAYDPDAIPDGIGESDLFIGIYNDQTINWTYLRSGTVNAEMNTITFTVTHFTIFAVLALPGGIPDITQDSTPTPTEMPTPVDKSGTPVWLLIILVIDGALTLVILAAIFIIANRRSQKKRGASGTRLPGLFRIPRLRRAPTPPKSK